jgi:tetratricopeptide (TPR) repeat protein
MLGQLDEAEAVTKEALAQAHTSGAEYPEIAVILHGQSDLLRMLGRYPEAEQAAHQAVDKHRRLNGPGHPETAWGLCSLGHALAKQQKYAEAEVAFREALGIFRKPYRGGHYSLVLSMDGLKQVLEAQGDRAGLDALAKEEADETMRTDTAGYHVRLAGMFLKNHSADIARKEKEDEARRLTQWAIEEYAQVAIDYPDDLKRRLSAAMGFVGLIEVCGASPGFANQVDEVKRRLSAELSEIVLKTRRLPDTNAAAEALYYTAVVQARLGDTAGYRATCKALVALPFEELKGLTRSRPIWTPCLVPDALDDPTLPVKLGEELFANDSLGDRPYILGAAQYRAGQYQQAALHLKESIPAFSSKSIVVTDSVNYPRLFLAMATWQLGQKNDARKLLAETLPDIEQEMKATSWNRRATLEILRREVEALIGQEEANEAVENAKPNNSAPTTDD